MCVSARTRILRPGVDVSVSGYVILTGLKFIDGSHGGAAPDKLPCVPHQSSEALAAHTSVNRGSDGGLILHKSAKKTNIVSLIA